MARRSGEGIKYSVHYSHDPGSPGCSSGAIGQRALFTTTPASESIVKTTATSSGAGFESWPGEVAMAYVTGMACSASHGRTSIIQRTAMKGYDQDGDAGSNGNGVRASERGDQIKFGLLGMAEFQGKDQYKKSSKYTIVCGCRKSDIK